MYLMVLGELGLEGIVGFWGGFVFREIWEIRSLWDSFLGFWFLMNGCLGRSISLVGRVKCYWRWEFISFSL